MDRVRGALWGVFIADSLSMPVHWYYNPRDIQRDFGRITDYAPPKKTHPSSIMSISNTGGHGRGGQEGRIIGDIINHGKHDFWGKSSVHYHQGMAAGENTLNAVCTRLVMRSIAAEKGYKTGRFLADYVQFMTTPGTHNDTYAESFHRDFFSNWAKGVAPERCAGPEAHNTPTVGGFVMLPPVILSCLGKSETEMRKATVEHLRLTHDSDMLASRAEVYAELVYKLAQGTSLKDAAAAAGKKIGLDIPALAARAANVDDSAVVGGMFSTACYITDSFPSILYLSYKYSDSFEKAVLANTNVGGENCHRGAALGAVMGAAVGESGIPKRFIEGLAATNEIRKEIDDFVAAVMPSAPPAVTSA